MTTTIKQYIRNEKRVPVGILLATKSEDGKLLVGWSMCGPKDNFDKRFGEQIARNRMMSEKPSAHKFGYTVPKEIVEHFLEKAKYVLHLDEQA